MKKNTHKKLVKNAVDLEESMRRGLKRLKEEPTFGFPIRPKKTSLFEKVLVAKGDNQ